MILNAPNDITFYVQPLKAIECVSDMLSHHKKSLSEGLSQFRKKDFYFFPNF